MKTKFIDGKAYIFEEKTVETQVPVTTYITKTEIKETQTDVINLSKVSSYRGTIWSIISCGSMYTVMLVTCADGVHLINIGADYCNWAVRGCNFSDLEATLVSLKAVYVGRSSITIK